MHHIVPPPFRYGQSTNELLAVIYIESLIIVSRQRKTRLMPSQLSSPMRENPRGGLLEFPILRSPRGRPLGKRQMERGTLSRWFLDSRRTIQYGGQDVEMSHAGKTHLHFAGVYFLVIFFPTSSKLVLKG